MVSELPQNVNIVVVRDDPDPVIERIAAVDPTRVSVRKLWHSFTPELYEQWPAPLVDRFIRTQPRPDEPFGAELEAILAEAHVLFCSYPFPQQLTGRMPNLRWAHWGFAGISNLNGSEFWASDILSTSSRGYSAPWPIAESALGAVFMFSRKLHLAVRQTIQKEFPVPPYDGAMLIRGKTLGIVGLGGIGSHLAGLAKGVGMRVVATRRSAEKRTEGVDGVDVLYPAAELHDMLAEADFVVVAAMWTPETEGLMDADAFAAMKPGAFIINIARGEIIDEPAMVAALESGTLAGAYLDVYTDEFNRPPDPRLLAHPNVVMSPHISQKADGSSPNAVDIFCDNLRRFLDGEALVNAINWERGY